MYEPGEVSFQFGYDTWKNHTKWRSQVLQALRKEWAVFVSRHESTKGSVTFVSDYADKTCRIEIQGEVSPEEYLAAWFAHNKQEDAWFKEQQKRLGIGQPRFIEGLVMTDGTFKQSALADWQFNPDYVDKLTGLEEDSNATSFVEGGKRARRAFRERAKPGVQVWLMAGSQENPEPKDFLFAVDGHAIGMLQSIGVQISVRTGLTLALAWPRVTGYMAQEVWEVKDIGPHTEQSGDRVLHGIRMTLVKDLNADNAVDQELL